MIAAHRRLAAAARIGREGAGTIRPGGQDGMGAGWEE